MLKSAFPILVATLLAARLALGAPVPTVDFKDGRLAYQADDRGNRVPDFSYAGYAAGEKPIPTVPARVVIGAPADDNTRAIQAAIDRAGLLAPDANGVRGAVLLPPGEYPVGGSLLLNHDGVVLRGSGMGDGGTTLVATGVDRRTVIEIRGKPLATVGEPRPITDGLVPVNAMTLTVADAGGIVAGDAVRISHPSTKEWIAALGMNDFGGDRHGPSWRPGSRDVHWVRTVSKVEGKTITLDAPLTFALDATFGTSTVTKLDASGLIRHVGVENLRITSTFDAKNPKDEEHAWFGVGIQHARDVWVRRITFQHLAGSAVAAWEASSRVTVEDCKSLAPVGEVGGGRRNSFFTNGQQVLMQRLYSEQGIHDFAVGHAAAGPNAFVQCESVDSLGESGAIESAACGTLFDRVRVGGQPLSLRNRGYQGQGTGWASFNGVLWNSNAAVIMNEKPALAYNWAFGTHGEYNGNGVWVSSDDEYNPESLYYAQLGDRIGAGTARDRARLILPPVQGSRAPTLESAAEAIDVSMNPRVDVSRWIDQLARENPIPTEMEQLTRPAAPMKPVKSKEPGRHLSIQNGWVLIGGELAVGREKGVPWWRGGLRPDDVANASDAITRFAPGRTGKGWTDDLDELTTSMASGGVVSVWQHPPLWFERRRDDHSRVQRMDGDVAGPFYETPWARTGQGTASDGLSKWDVTRTNPWYFNRLRQFADLGAEKGLILFNGLYMQHSILEAGAHYADFPWRSANNINKVGIPEPVFFAGDKLIYVAQQFYDVSDPERAALHRAYMRNVLNELADKPNVILFLSEEYTGPLAFTQFWLDVVAEWKRETGKQVTIALYATKDVTDAILADAKRAAVVSILYNRYNAEGWWYQPDGTLYAPEGGRNLAPRQWSRLLKPKNAGFEQVHRAVREYRTRYPDKPFVYQGPAELSWAVVLGGGSLASLPKTTDAELLKAIATMTPVADEVGLRDGAGNALLLLKAMPKAEQVVEIDMRSGQVKERSDAGEGLYWIRVKQK